MKLYEGISTRLGEKHLGKGKQRDIKLDYGATLKPGDLFSSCKGYNEVIHSIDPCWWKLRKGRVIHDFTIQSTSGGNCSLRHCCTVPLETKEEIVAYWLRENDEWAISFFSSEEKWKNSSWYMIREDLRAGIEVFNEDGTITDEYNHYWCVIDKDDKEIACFLIKKQAEKIFELPEAHAVVYKTLDLENRQWSKRITKSK